ncbi:MAG: hypothetical protein WCJ19_04420 [bacterium]
MAYSEFTRDYSSDRTGCVWYEVTTLDFSKLKGVYEEVINVTRILTDLNTLNAALAGIIQLEDTYASNGKLDLSSLKDNEMDHLKSHEYSILILPWLTNSLAENLPRTINKVNKVDVPIHKKSYYYSFVLDTTKKLMSMCNPPTGKNPNNFWTLRHMEELTNNYKNAELGTKDFKNLTNVIGKAFPECTKVLALSGRSFFASLTKPKITANIRYID